MVTGGGAGGEVSGEVTNAGAGGASTGGATAGGAGNVLAGGAGGAGGAGDVATGGAGGAASTYVPGDLVVTEVMFNPASAPEIEWVELCNITDNPIALTGYTFWHNDNPALIAQTSAHPASSPEPRASEARDDRPGRRAPRRRDEESP